LNLFHENLISCFQACNTLIIILNTLIYTVFNYVKRYMAMNFILI